MERDPTEHGSVDINDLAFKDVRRFTIGSWVTIFALLGSAFAFGTFFQSQFSPSVVETSAWESEARDLRRKLSSELEKYEKLEEELVASVELTNRLRAEITVSMDAQDKLRQQTDDANGSAQEAKERLRIIERRNIDNTDRWFTRTRCFEAVLKEMLEMASQVDGTLTSVAATGRVSSIQDQGLSTYLDSVFYLRRDTLDFIKSGGRCPVRN